MLSLAGKRILVVEDEFLLALDLVGALEDGGAEVVGPVPSVESALRTVADRQLDLALLDLNLAGVPSFEVADALIEKGVSFIFTTGYDLSFIPARFTAVPRCSKPLDVNAVAAALERALEKQPANGIPGAQAVPPR